MAGQFEEGLIDQSDPMNQSTELRSAVKLIDEAFCTSRRTIAIWPVANLFGKKVACSLCVCTVDH